jgi:hypothetical protein
MLGLALLAGCARAGFGQPDARAQDAPVTDGMSHRDSTSHRDAITRETVHPDALHADRASRDGAPLDVKIVVGIKTGILLTCGSSPGNDCRGTLFGGLYTAAMPPFSGFVAGNSVAGADLQSGQVQVVVPGVPPGTYSAWAFLAESGTLPTPPKPVNGDPVMALPVTVKVPAAAPVSVTLPGRWFTN